MGSIISRCHQLCIPSKDKKTNTSYRPYTTKHTASDVDILNRCNAIIDSINNRYEYGVLI